MRRWIWLVIVFLVVGQSNAPRAQAMAAQVQLTPAASVQVERSCQNRQLEPEHQAPREGFWNRLWASVVARARVWSRAILTWFTGTAKEGLLRLWERIRWEGEKLAHWLRELWRWMDLKGGVGPLPQ